MSLTDPLIFVALFGAAIFVWCGILRPNGYTTRDLYVIDGDTVADGERRIRLSGIDAPELSQVHGGAAKSHLKKLIKDRDVRVVVEGEDAYGRTLATLWTGKGNVCRAMVADGYAVASSFEAHYASDMRTAKNHRRGLWAKGGIESPSDHRRRAGPMKRKIV